MSTQQTQAVDGGALGAVIAFFAKCGMAYLTWLGLGILAIIGFIAGCIVEAAYALRWLLITVVAIFALVFLWNQGSKDLGRQPETVGFFEGLGSKTEVRNGVKVNQTVWGKTSVGIPYIGWQDVTKDVKAAEAQRKAGK